METRLRSFAKTLSWRLVAATVTASVGYFITGNATFSLALGVTDTCVKIGVQYAHERAWTRIPFGRAREPEFFI